MRRLAVQQRKDGYSSNRDYQQLHEKIAQRILPRGGGNKIVFHPGALTPTTTASLIGFGGFVRTPSAISIVVSLSIDGATTSRTIETHDVWTRFGLSSATPAGGIRQVSAIIEWDTKDSIDVWGVDLDFLHLPEVVTKQNPTPEDLNSSHLAPETFYLKHDNAIALDIDEAQSTPFALERGATMYLKKCSYCQRLLPINPALLGSLSFHKHNAKISKHQNECRSCKKWRINDSFNPLRTTDQLHESSAITRERKILLREPEILQEIKDRTGAGLKSQIWERFGRRCFYCETPVKLDECHLDHTRPLAYLWPIDEHATCLCAEHNNLKKDKFPVDFYTDAQLHELSKITGLPYEELTRRTVNQEELDRIVGDITTFALEWDPRTFAAIARKVIEIQPRTDLFKILRQCDPRVYKDLIAQLRDRPDPVA